MERVRRRQVVVDKTFQYEYLKVWVIMGIVLATVVAVLVVFPRMLDRKGVNPLIIQILIGTCLFILLYSLLMGVITIVLTHRVAGAAFAIRRFVRKMIDGQFDDKLFLRKNDYLRDVADEINTLHEMLKTRQSEAQALAQEVETLHRGLDGTHPPSPDQKAKMAEVASRLRATWEPREPANP